MPRGTPEVAAGAAGTWRWSRQAGRHLLMPRGTPEVADGAAGTGRWSRRVGPPLWVLRKPKEAPRRMDLHEDEPRET